MIEPIQPPATAYDAVAYPTAIFTQTHPDRMAAMARLHGISAADPATARVLEVACGDAMNLLAVAAAAPGAICRGFDLAPSVIDRGQQRARAAGLDNVHLEVRDLLEAADGLEGQVDYVIAHGLYAWVPEPVREALFALIGRVLAPNGIAFISHNALPGGYFRMAVRDLMRHFIAPGATPAEMLRTARSVLSQFAESQPGDGAAMTAFREQATRTLEQPDGLLFHDELTEHYYPQLHSDVSAMAERSGLIFLADTGHGRLEDGFLPHGVAPEADVQAQIVRLAQERDYIDLRYFRRSLFVRREAAPTRNLDPGTISALWASSRCARTGDDWRGDGGSEFSAGDATLDAALDRLAEARPGRLPVASLGLDEARLRSLLQLADLGALELHVGMAPFATALPARPILSPLAREMIREGFDTLCTLDHSTVRIDDPVLRRFFAGVDGTRDPSGLEALAGDCGFADPAAWRHALDIALYKALIMPSREA